MSVEAITWALRQPVPASSAKFVLVVLANCAGADHGCAYPSIAYLCESTGQDRKTVGANLRRLIDWGLIEDTGERAGRTKQVIVYRLNCGPSLFESAPKTGPFRRAETAPKTGQFKRKETAPKTELLEADETSPKTEQSQKRNSPVFSSKEARFSPETGPKTGHGTVNNPQEPFSLSGAGARTGDVIDQDAGEILDTDGDGNSLPPPVDDALALRAGVEAAKVLRNIGIRVTALDPHLLALCHGGFSVEAMALLAAELVLRKAGLFNDPDMHPELLEMLASGCLVKSPALLALTADQLGAVRTAAADVSIAYIRKSLTGRRDDAASQKIPRNGHGNHREGVRESVAERAERYAREGDAREAAESQFGAVVAFQR